jgi:2-dehydropantoate 2-reductase
MGSLIAGRLAAIAGKNGSSPETTIDSVVLYGRASDHLSAIHAHGLTIVERTGSRNLIPVSATTNPADLKGSDVVLVLVKSWASGEAVAPLRSHLNRDTVVITLQNGLGNASALRSALLNEGVRPHVYLGVTTQAAIRVEPGVIVHTGSGITAVGRRANPVNTHLRDIATAITNAGLQTVAVDDIHRWVWRKLAVNAAINPLTALAGVQNAAISTDPGLRAAAEAIVREVVAVGKASGVKIELKEVLAAVDEVARSTGENRSSMLVDVETGTPTEIDAINGAIVSEARRHAIKTPANQLMTALVRAREGRYQAEPDDDNDAAIGAIA